MEEENKTTNEKNEKLENTEAEQKATNVENVENIEQHHINVREETQNNTTVEEAKSEVHKQEEVNSKINENKNAESKNEEIANKEFKAEPKNGEIANKEFKAEPKNGEIINKEPKNEPIKQEKPKMQEEHKKQEKVKTKISKKKVTAIIAIVIIIIALMIFSTIFALINMNNNKILSGISILGIDVEGLTIEEAQNRVNDAIEQKFQSETDNIILKHGEEETSVEASTFNAKFDVENAVKDAYNIGRDGNIITNNYAILGSMLFKKEITPTLYLDEELMQKTISDIGVKMQDAVKEYSYSVDGKTLKISSGEAGYIVKKEELRNAIYEELQNIHTPYQEIEIPVEYKEPDQIDLQKIRNEIYKEPQDAYVEKNPTKVHVEVDGIDFEISIEEAQKLIAENKEEYEIPLKITKPSKTLADLGEDAFPDLLAKFSTIYDASERNRSHNIELASKKINGTIIMPGETFSYNKVTGLKTIANGYKEGTAYVGGKVVPDIGGGVCQVSSTLYNVALYANLEITERSNHMFLTSYVPASRDATVYDGSLDFCFKNTRSYPIKIEASAGSGVCKVSLYGIKEEVEYEVVIQSKVTSYISNKVTYIEDSTLEEGKEKVQQVGHNGCRSEGYRILKKNGEIISTTLLSKDIYNAQERIVRVGTKKVTQTTTQPSENTETTQNTGN